jgi:predicted PurR-regulated permease PerM
MEKIQKLPFFIRISVVFVGLLAFLTFLYLGRDIIIPIVIATLFAIVFNPLVNKLVKDKFNRTLAISIVVFIALLIIVGSSILFVSQISSFSASFPTLVNKLQTVLDQIILSIRAKLHMSSADIALWFKKIQDTVITNSSAIIGKTIGTIGSTMFFIILIPVYVFMILYYKPLLLDFIRKLYGERNSDQINKIFEKTKTTIQSYLIGLVKQAVIVASLYIITFFILGIPYAVLLGITGALLNIIPFLGAYIAITIFVVIALVTASPTTVLLVIIAFIVIHAIDNMYIVPKIIASQVRLNALISLTAVLAGNAIWGIPGMFLSIPLAALIKVVSDHISSLEPWGYVMGDMEEKKKVDRPQSIVHRKENINSSQPEKDK